MSYAPATVNTYYLVSKDIYDKCERSNQNVDEKLAEFPKRLTKKIKAVLTALAASGLRWDVVGNVDGNSR